MRKFGSIFMAAILGSILTLVAYHFYSQDSEVKLEYIDSAPTAQVGYMIDENGDKIAMDFTGVASKVTEAVVHIKSVQSQSSAPNTNDPFRFFFDHNEGGNGLRPQQSSGSGVIINANGYIVTNNHVVQSAEIVEVTLSDNRTVKAEIIGTDPDTDIALIKIEENNLPFLAFADSDKSRVGEWVLAVGNPFNLNSTVTAGIISAKERNINIIGRTSGNTAIESFIQTDAAINPGNSGGALVNLSGGLIGINTAIASPTGSYSGYGFAVPSNLASKIVEDLIDFGIVQRGMLGVMIANINSQLVKEKNLNLNEGAYVSEVMENSAAEDAGIKTGDIIIELDGHTIKSSTAVTQYIGMHRPGDKVTVKVDRKGKINSYTVTLKNRKGAIESLKKEKIIGLASLQLEVETIDEADLRKLDLENGVRVKSIGNGIIRRYTDMHEGFIITKMNETEINSPEELNKLLEKVQKGSIVTLSGIYAEFPREFLYSFRM